MVKLETTLIPTLNRHLNNWYRFVGDSFCFINCQSVDFVFSLLNNFYPHIQSTYELEHLGHIGHIIHIKYHESSENQASKELQ